jgi:hypothetical protein
MSSGLGNIAFSEPPGVGGGGVVPNPNGARDGLTIEGGYVVLGQLLADVTYPATLIEDRQIPMADHAVRWLLSQPDPAFIGINHAEGPLFFDYLGSSLSGTRWQTYWPQNFGADYAPFGDGGQFGTGYSSYPGVNEPTTARPNVVAGFWMYNEDYNFSRIDPAEAAFSFRSETFFVIGSDPTFEFHVPEIITSGGATHRIMSWYISRTGAATVGFAETVIDDWSIFSEAFDPAGGQYFIHMEYDAAGDNTTFAITSQNAGGVSELVFSNWTDGGAFITWQTGEMNVFSSNIVVLTSKRTILDPSEYSNLINPSVCSASELDTPNVDAMLDVQSTLLGFRIPNMTTVQRLAIVTAPTGGLIVFDSTIGKAYIWVGAAWQQIQSV